MHRCGSGFLLTLAIAFVVALTGCLGKSSTNLGNAGVQSVTLSPANTFSLEVGGTQVFSASGKDAAGKPVLGFNIQYVVGVPPGTITPAPLTINHQWERLRRHMGPDWQPVQCRQSRDRHRKRCHQWRQQPDHYRLRPPAHR